MSNVPAFTPVPATPVQLQPVEAPGAKKPRKAAAKKPKGKKAAKAVPAEKRQRRSRVAPLMMDAAQALNAVNGLGKKEVDAMRQLVELLNPLPRPARARVLASVASILGQ